MAESVTKLRLFVASTSEFDEERICIRVVVDELNRSIADSQKVTIETVSWDTHAWPGIGTDPQDVINREIHPSDIFVGLIWKRLGTPTPRAASGTVEEFERAYEAWMNRKSPQIFLYFKCTPFFPRSLDEIEALAQVTDFRMRLRDRGVLYWEFQNLAEFQRDFRQHLSSLLLNSESLFLHPGRIRPGPEVAIERLADLKALFEALPQVQDLPVSVVHIDLDNFKRFNDQHGYHKADEFLDDLSKYLASDIGSKGVLYRIGGDEFAVVMPNARAREAKSLARDLQLTVRAVGKKYGGVTASFGVASTRTAPTKDLLRGAHTATFVSKMRGSNTITAYPLSAEDRDLLEMAIARGIS